MVKEEVPDTVNWAFLYKKLDTCLVELVAQSELAEDLLRLRLVALAFTCQQAYPPSRASQ